MFSQVDWYILCFLCERNYNLKCKLSLKFKWDLPGGERGSRGQFIEIKCKAIGWIDKGMQFQGFRALLIIRLKVVLLCVNVRFCVFSVWLGRGLLSRIKSMIISNF